VSGLPVAVDDLAQVAASDACAREGRLIDEVVGDRRLIVRVDRMELSKNIVRGFLAYEELLARREDLRGHVVFLAYCYPSRETLPEYVEYHANVEATAHQVNDRWGTREWSPVALHTDDNFARSVAALTRYDALLVNPVRDGMNLVAKEGAALNRNNGVVVLSRQAGAWDELSEASIGVNPFDVTETADALERALAMPAEERRRMSAAARAAPTARSLRDWLDDQLAAVGETL